MLLKPADSGFVLKNFEMTQNFLTGLGLDHHIKSGCMNSTWFQIVSLLTHQTSFFHHTRELIFLVVFKNLNHPDMERGSQGYEFSPLSPCFVFIT